MIFQYIGQLDIFPLYRW